MVHEKYECIITTNAYIYRNGNNSPSKKQVCSFRATQKVVNINFDKLLLTSVKYIQQHRLEHWFTCVINDVGTITRPTFEAAPRLARKQLNNFKNFVNKASPMNVKT
jgi:hypothetical protein